MKECTLSNRIHCRTEYSALKRVLVVTPSFMKITTVINETQKYYEDVNIDIPRALDQHETFVHVLKDHGVEVVELPAAPDLHEQVFTRDIAFVIHDQLFVASMNEHVRQEETSLLREWLYEYSIPFQEQFPDSIEGGDVLIDGKTVWIGISGRTSPQAIETLRERLPSYTIEPLKLEDDILHLDCVFNIISEGTALVYPPSFTDSGLDKLQSQFNLIPVTREEQFHMGPNVLSIEEGKLISLSQNQRLNDELRSKGFQVIPIEFSEIIKSGGSFRCCTLPLLRASDHK
ncbi:dimethylarginine dimethylaminohydrolase family protein [Halobacillus sp. K22]|uniref:dimethylarginine dimethylaminohydrolase family protein n=1 Tax=Halobacillus sp. K22 TaxID=3457431 RepID=UPI003FCEAFA3